MTSISLIPDKRLILLSTDSQTSSSLHGDVQSGGTWWPTHCEARDRVAVVIPYRARKNHLGLLLHQLHSLLQRQLIHYKIYVIEQVPESTNFLSIQYFTYTAHKTRYIYPTCEKTADIFNNPIYWFTDIPSPVESAHAGGFNDK